MVQNRIYQYDNVAGSSGEDDEKNQFLEFMQPALEKVGDAIANTVRKQPLAGVAVGLTIGVVLGCLIKRR